MALGDLVVRLSADTADFQSDMGKAAHISEREMERMVAKATAAGELIGRAMSAAAGHVSRLIGETLKAGDELSKMAQRTGFTVERLSELEFAGKLADVSVKQLSTGLGFFNKTLVEAQNESSKTGKIFQALGVDINAGPQKAFEQLVKAVAGLKDVEVQGATLRTVFGRGLGDSLIPLISSLDETSARARKLGIVMGTDLAKDAERFNDAIMTLQASSRALAITALTPASQAIATIAENLVQGKEKSELFRVALIELAKTYVAIAGSIGSVVPVWGKYLEEGAQKTFNDLERMRQGNPVRPIGPAPNAIPVLQKTIDEAKLKAALANISEPKARAGRAPRDTLEQEARKQIAETRRIQEADLQAQRYYQQELGKIADEQAKVADEEAQARAKQIDDTRRLQDMDLQAMRYFAKEVEAINKGADKADDWAKQLGLTFSSAFEDAITHGKKFRDVLQGIAQDISRMLVRKTITEPFVNAFGKVMGGVNVGSVVKRLLSGIGGGGGDVGGAAVTPEMLGDFWSGSYASGTSYVPRTGLALVHQGEAIIPAAQNRAGGAGVTVVIHQDNRGVDPAVIGRMEQANARLRRDIVPLVADATRRGGARRRG